MINPMPIDPCSSCLVIDTTTRPALRHIDALFLCIRMHRLKEVSVLSRRGSKLKIAGVLGLESLLCIEGKSLAPSLQASPSGVCLAKLLCGRFVHHTNNTSTTKIRCAPHTRETSSKQAVADPRSSRNLNVISGCTSFWSSAQRLRASHCRLCERPILCAVRPNLCDQNKKQLTRAALLPRKIFQQRPVAQRTGARTCGRTHACADYLQQDRNRRASALGSNALLS